MFSSSEQVVKPVGPVGVRPIVKLQEFSTLRLRHLDRFWFSFFLVNTCIFPATSGFIFAMILGRCSPSLKLFGPSKSISTNGGGQ